jgi:hypothetical protein
MLLLAGAAGCQVHQPPPLTSKLIAQSPRPKRTSMLSSAAKPTPVFTGGIESDEAMQEAIDKHIFRGMPLAECQRWFEREGFTWGVYEDLPQYGPPDPTLICRRYDPVSFAVTRQWIVSCKIEGDAIADVRVVHGFVGP